MTRTVDDLPGVTGEYRLLALRATSPSGPVTISVGTNLEPARETLFLVRTSLLVAAPVLLGLVATMTWITVGRALHPVEAIRSHVAHLSSTNRRRRVPVPRIDDEIGRLARTMNAMLDRLQAASDKQNRFVADASHELQSPLAAARADLEVALAHPDATNWPDTARDVLEENRHVSSPTCSSSPGPTTPRRPRRTHRPIYTRSSTTKPPGSPAPTTPTSTPPP